MYPQELTVVEPQPDGSIEVKFADRPTIRIVNLVRTGTARIKLMDYKNMNDMGFDVAISSVINGLDERKDRIHRRAFNSRIRNSYITSMNMVYNVFQKSTIVPPFANSRIAIDPMPPGRLCWWSECAIIDFYINLDTIKCTDCIFVLCLLYGEADTLVSGIFYNCKRRGCRRVCGISRRYTGPLRGFSVFAPPRFVSAYRDMETHIFND